MPSGVSAGASGVAVWNYGVIAFCGALAARSDRWDTRIFHRSLIEVIDAILVNWFLPLIALAVVVGFGWRLPPADKAKNFIKEGKFVSQSMYSHWVFMVKSVHSLCHHDGFSSSDLWHS